MRGNRLDPLLGPAAEMERLPVKPERREADEIAARIMCDLERLALVMAGESNPVSAGQLRNTAEALAVCIINLMAYARGRIPRVAKKPDVSIITPN